MQWRLVDATHQLRNARNPGKSTQLVVRIYHFLTPLSFVIAAGCEPRMSLANHTSRDRAEEAAHVIMWRDKACLAGLYGRPCMLLLLVYMEPPSSRLRLSVRNRQTRQPDRPIACLKDNPRKILHPRIIPAVVMHCWVSPTGFSLS